MSERDFEIGAKKFKVNKINAFEQFHIVRRLAPILSDLIPIANKMSKKNKAQEDQVDETDFEALGPIFMGIGKLSDEDANRVLLGLCSAIEMHQPKSNSWAYIVRGGNLMFSDFELPELLQLAGRAFQYNMAGFFSMLPQTSPGGA